MKPTPADTPRARPRTEIVEVRLSRRLLAAIDRYGTDKGGLTRQEVLALAIGEWATDRGYIAPRPTATVALEKLNARNDG